MNTSPYKEPKKATAFCPICAHFIVPDSLVYEVVPHWLTASFPISFCESRDGLGSLLMTLAPPLRTRRGAENGNQSCHPRGSRGRAPHEPTNTHFQRGASGARTRQKARVLGRSAAPATGSHDSAFSVRLLKSCCSTRPKSQKEFNGCVAAIIWPSIFIPHLD